MLHYLAKLQSFLPHYLFSRIAYCLGSSENVALKKFFIKWFVNKFKVDLSQAERKEISDYKSFNDFFTRHLDPASRKLMAGAVISPADGTMLSVAKIKDNSVFHAKGHHYTLNSLLGNYWSENETQQIFAGGSHFTIYLSPKDYHRVHMPCAGSLVAMHYIPGKLFSVNPHSLASVNDIFARNERVISIFKTEFGYMAIILVGAMIVGSIATIWHGVVCPPRTHKDPQSWNYPEDQISLKQGDELGYFQMGSTVIALFSKDYDFDPNLVGHEIQFGQQITN